MSIISEALTQLEALLDKDSSVIKVNVVVEPDTEFNEEYLPSGNILDKYDDQTLDDWYNFVDTIEGIIKNFGDVVNIIQSKHGDSLSEYIDFYSYDKDGNKKNYIIDLRLSDHAQTSAGRNNRIRHVQKINTNYRLEGITVNNKTYHSYIDAENAIRKILAQHLM